MSVTKVKAPPRSKVQLLAKRLNSHFNPVFEGERTYPDPVVVENYANYGGEGHTAIVWEDGPADWAYLVEGGWSDEDRALLHQANEEFGTSRKLGVRKGVKVPDGLYTVPEWSFVLSVYRDEWK